MALFFVLLSFFVEGLRERKPQKNKVLQNSVNYEHLLYTGLGDLQALAIALVGYTGYRVTAAL